MPLPSGFEWIVILVIALLILGPGKLPDVASAVGKSIREFRKASSEVQEAVKVDTSPLPNAPAVPPAPNVLAQPPAAPPASASEIPAAPATAAKPASSEATTESH
jgi:TatA/E family protein of Tat protein translocase